MQSTPDLQSIIPILKQNDVEFAAVFGSRARGDAREDSDVDILIRYKKTPGFFKFIHLERELSQLLNAKVDLVTEPSLNTRLRPYVLKDLQVIYGEKK